MTIAALTGHRPPKAGLTYGHNTKGDWAAVNAVRNFITSFDVDLLIVGGALGFDTLGARAAWLEDIPFDVYVPFEGQESRWSNSSQLRYHAMLASAHTVKICSSGGYSAQKMQKRNIQMVDEAHTLATWWDGSKGGTANAITYAKYLSRSIVHLYFEVDPS